MSINLGSVINNAGSSVGYTFQSATQVTNILSRSPSSSPIPFTIGGGIIGGVGNSGTNVSDLSNPNELFNMQSIYEVAKSKYETESAKTVADKAKEAAADIANKTSTVSNSDGNGAVEAILFSAAKEFISQQINKIADNKVMDVLKRFGISLDNLKNFNFTVDIASAIRGAVRGTFDAVFSSSGLKDNIIGEAHKAIEGLFNDQLKSLINNFDIAKYADKVLKPLKEDFSKIKEKITVTLKDKLKIATDLFEKITGKIDFSSINKGIENFVSKLDVNIGDIASKLGVSIEDIASKLGVGLEELTSNLNLNIDDLASKLGVGIEDFTGKLGLKTEDFATNFGANIENIASKIVPGIENLTSKLGSNIENIVSNLDLNKKIDSLVSNLEEEIGGKIKNVVSPIIEKSTKIIEKVSSEIKVFQESLKNYEAMVTNMIEGWQTQITSWLGEQTTQLISKVSSELGVNLGSLGGALGL